MKKGFTLLLLMLTGIAASAQDLPQQTTQCGFMVRDMRVEGLQRITAGTVFNYLPINVGDCIDTKRIEEAMRTLYENGLFRDIEFRRDGDVLVIIVLERPTIESLEFTGNKDIETEDLERNLRDVGLAQGKPFNPSILEEVSMVLIDTYFDQGKYAVKVETEVDDIGDNRVEISINISEGERAEIRQINIVGNTAYSDKDLDDSFKLTTPHFLCFYKKDCVYSKEVFFGDLEALRSFYMDRGYINFEIESTQVAISPDKSGIFLTININEGELYTVSRVSVAGDMVVPEEQLTALIAMKNGQIFSRRMMTNSVELMQRRMGFDGYARAEIDPVPEIDDEENEVAITFYVTPGNRVYVRRVSFSGSQNTDDYVFRREMRQLESSWLSNSGLDRSRQRIQRLPFIQEVDYETFDVPGSADLVDVDFTIEEGLPGQFGGGLGYSDSQKLILNGNFVHTNFMGTGNRISLELNSGRFSKAYSVAHTDPYRTVDGISRTVSLGYRDFTQFTSGASDFSTTTLTLGLQYGFPLTEYQQIRFGINWSDAELSSNSFQTLQAINWVRLNGSSSTTAAGGVIFFKTEFETLEFMASWIFDSRNRALFATRGSRHRLSASITSPGSEVEFYTINYDFRKYWPITRNWIVMVNSELGFGEALNDTTDIPPFRNMFAGGPDTVRGYKENRLGPIDTLGNPYGGNLKVASQLELIVPLPEKIGQNTRASIFYDIGNVFSTGDTLFFDKMGNPVSYDYDFDDLKHSAGIAVQWLSPMGVFRFSYAKPLNDFSGNASIFGDETENFQFSIGSAF